MASRTRVAVLAGGVGAARFLRGLYPLTDPARLTIIVNTADDETFFGLHVSPDIDTVTYTLAERVDPKQGWGVARDSFACLTALERFYQRTWFRLGDADLATHIFRTDALRALHLTACGYEIETEMLIKVRRRSGLVTSVSAAVPAAIQAPYTRTVRDRASANPSR